MKIDLEGHFFEASEVTYVGPVLEHNHHLVMGFLSKHDYLIANWFQFEVNLGDKKIEICSKTKLEADELRKRLTGTISG